MRISRIRLSGFKSFVDPTTLELPGNLTGVVGPNGCGKSNIIDALLWVLGESSAKHLRGDSMADVIFNGSNSRKPVGQASVEIVLDNSEGKLEGQYAKFSEIGLKRQVGRDGVSLYFLNGSRCRRKDVIDVFLGTGVGKGGYSVIAQGMISRVIEAKPEELRGFLEEAAGISRYKERRRETENRMRHTNENLERLADIRSELEKQLQHLDRQARAAERYQVLKKEQRTLEAQLLAIRWRDIDVAVQQRHKVLNERQTGVDAAVAELREAEAGIAELREQQVATNDAFNQVQSRYYAASADIARLEQALQHSREQREQLEANLEEAGGRLGATARHLEDDSAAVTALDSAMASLGPELDSARNAEREAGEVHGEAEQAMQSWQEEWENFNSRYNEASQGEKVDRLRLEHIEQSVSESGYRLQALREEHDGLDLAALESGVAAGQSAAAQVEQSLRVAADERDTLQRALQTARARADELARELDQARIEYQAVVGRVASLKQLQDSALNRDAGALPAWLSSNGFAAAPRLAEALRIDAGWEKAVEAALCLPLDAVCSEEAADRLVGSSVPAGVPGGLGVVSRHAGEAERNNSLSLPLLLDKVGCDWSLTAVLAGVYAAESLAVALEARPRLRGHESIVTPEGFRIGPNWLQNGIAGESDSVLERERALADAQRNASAMQARLQSRAAELDGARGEVDTLEQKLETRTRELGELQAELADRRGAAVQVEADLKQARQRLEAISAEVDQLDGQAASESGEMSRLREQIVASRSTLEAFEGEREALMSRRDALRSALDDARDQLNIQRNRAHEFAVRLEGQRSQHESLTAAIRRNEELKAQIEGRCQSLRDAIAASAAPQSELGEQLERALEARVAVEEELVAARKAVETTDTALRDAETALRSIDEKVEARRGELEQARLDARTLEVKSQDIVAQINATEFEMSELLDELGDEAAEDQWQERLAGVERRVSRLGPINLAAIDEHGQLSERKDYLDRQNDDLTAALATLTEAMQKIDRETRTRFKETFDRVNAGMQELFPVLFGGGHAYLEMSDDDLLAAGVSVFARPPGKRNSTIHLLSGGEKALTALSFIFSLFKLNPAPFCLLDEVDAPLDDANVGRFCELVKSMSSSIQFMFITHNKLTMEIAQQLIGVTMHEPGVSRLVTVDMEEAVELAATA
ncbi:MAG: chromosome segregation protein SMC [Gammaproteobacteria bacterium]|nr:chromosome segregation protein SMC [Gammaproteobacteria bacterium]